MPGVSITMPPLLSTKSSRWLVVCLPGIRRPDLRGPEQIAPGKPVDKRGFPYT
jgi:hypothetical protein